MIINYKIEFYTDWHCGSGLAAGADVDALVVKDENGMPFVPGKTMKGLIREAVEEIRHLQGKDLNDTELAEAFGSEVEKENYDVRRGTMFFANAVLETKEYDAIVSNKAARFMYRDIASTAIDENGIAKEHSLRKIEVVVPCTLHGAIYGVPKDLTDEIKNSFGFIKRMGQNRNRGLGRCTISSVSVEKEGGEQ